MRLRRLTAGSAVVVLAGLVGLFISPATAITSAAASTITGARVQHARYLGTTSFHSSAAASAAIPGRFFNSDGYLSKDLPKDSVGAAPAGSIPSVRASSTSAASSATSAFGVNALDQAVTHSFLFNVEPPDQGLCAGNGYVIEPVNLVFAVYSESNFERLGAEPLETFFNQPYAFGVQGGDVTVQGDVKCYYDQLSQRWFISQLDLNLGPSGTGSPGSSQIMLAVSTTSNPLGSYNLYSIDNTDGSNPGCACFGDQPLLGANQDAIFITTNEFSILNANFNGSVVYAIDKAALVSGAASPNVWSDDVGLNMATPDGSCYTSPPTGGSNTGICWYSIQPAESPTGTVDTAAGGTEYALSALDFVGAGDHRIAVWAFTNTSSITGTPNIGVAEYTLGSQPYAMPPFATQKSGPIPLAYCVRATGCGLFTKATRVPEGLIQTNDDRMNQVVYADGMLWGGLNTALSVGSAEQAGIAWFIVTPSGAATTLTAALTNDGYVAPRGADVLFPSIGVTSAGQGVMTFTLTGPNNYPSSAYATINSGGIGPVTIALAGASPQDGFTEYQGYGTPLLRPRWGDYSAAVADGSNVYFASEMIQSPNCANYGQFRKDFTCGGTRDFYANWGTSLNVVTP